ncbi:MAG TPA: SH3-like domain-containing protein [Candidatus Baltobacteraceae bacterium]|nr:SH3-like domain-containing protein [Candidatus Baltobacteraceae bacterium]
MFEVGEWVRTREKRGVGHTRLPKYLEHRRGRVIRVLGSVRYADEAARLGAGASEQLLYTVQFEQGGHCVCADLFESYLENDA